MSNNPYSQPSKFLRIEVQSVDGDVAVASLPQTMYIHKDKITSFWLNKEHELWVIKLDDGSVLRGNSLSCSNPY